ncbi:uridylate-specific endoribonuclease B-like [Branchiostoma lanceolatum]|uniref:uridylate-specific endoribonuclease B-like n=1 Tax=Branchiostoma lanceolatum TaxID=7740 RepID=UPI003454631E
MVSVSDFCAKLWSLDKNRLVRGRDYDIDLEDDLLFSFVDEANLKSIPTFKALRRLFRKYDHVYVTAPHESAEAWTFLNHCLETPVMQETHKFLAQGGVVPVSQKGFRNRLYTLWFGPYYRPNTGRCSTAFEHTFVGEPCHDYVYGFHNWVRLYEQERDHRLTYEGWEFSVSNDHIIGIDIDWNGYMSKTGTSFFVGTSPEFELAIYTTCFLAGDEETRVRLGIPWNVTIATYDVDGEIAACYPKVEDVLIEEGRDFLEYLDQRNIGPELGKYKLKNIYENDYTNTYGQYGRWPGTPFSWVLCTLEMEEKVDVWTNYHGVDIVEFLE